MPGSDASFDAEMLRQDLFLARDGAQLRPGDRFPNFLLPDQQDRARWFIQYGQGYGQLVLLDPARDVQASLTPLASAYASADLQCLGLAGAPPAGPSDFPILIDSANRIRPALRRMAGFSRQAMAAFLLDRNQRVLAMSDHGDLLRWGLDTWAKLKRPDSPAEIDHIAPVLTVPNVLSTEQCRVLMERWQTHGRQAGYVTSLVEGEQVRRVYDELKRRTDHRLDDPAVKNPLLSLIGRRLAPELERAFQYRNFAFDRVLIACYDAASGDYFRRHRDNQTPATAARRFALTLNLNSDEYDGGELIFPEYGAARYKVPAGGAIVFSCSLLHEALPVVRGRRFALLSFLRDMIGPEPGGPRGGETR